jgi:predicted Zn-dependent protease with MMP-like domain
MKPEKFEELVIEALSGLPEEFQNKLENIDVVIAARPTREQLTRMGIKRGTTLLGLYEGVPLTKRGRNYGMVPPDKITIFQKPIEDQCRSEREIAIEVQKVARHEIAHYFGMDEASLERIENET